MLAILMAFAACGLDLVLQVLGREVFILLSVLRESSKCKMLFQCVCGFGEGLVQLVQADGAFAPLPFRESLSCNGNS